MNARIRQCYICSLPVPQHDEEELRNWEVIKIDWNTQYRCPKHRIKAPRLATIGDAIKSKKKRSL